MEDFKMLNKKLLSLVLTILVMGSLSSTALADTLYESPSITVEEPTITTIPFENYDGDIENLPVFETEEAALAYASEWINEIEENSAIIELPLINEKLRSTNGNVFVTQYRVAAGVYVRLYANYGTTGYNNTGKISYISPYTLFETGPTLGTWTQANAGHNISPDGKDAYIFANGTVQTRVMVHGAGVQFISFPVNLGAYVIVTR